MFDFNGYRIWLSFPFVKYYGMKCHLIMSCEKFENRCLILLFVYNVNSSTFGTDEKKNAPILSHFNMSINEMKIEYTLYDENVRFHFIDSDEIK